LARRSSAAIRLPCFGARKTRLAGGGAGNLAGVSLLRFSDDGLVLEERDFWHQS
jgi:hypothetical protein